MRHFLIVILWASLLAPVLVSPTPTQAADCQFVLGFKTVHDLVPDVVGDCKTNELHNPRTGDTLQHTTKGLLVWRKRDNFTGFTDGHRTWINGPHGLAVRLNTERFPWEKDIVPPKIVRLGAGQSGNAIGFSIVFQNANPTFAVVDSTLKVTAFDAGGKVLNSQSGIVKFILPNQQRAVSNVMTVPLGAKVTRVDMQLTAGKFAAAASASTFATTGSVITPDKSYFRAVGVVQNPYKQTVTNVYVSAVAYNKAGAIVGGGSATIGKLEAGAKAEITIPVVASEPPAKIELYPSLSARSSLQ